MLRSYREFSTRKEFEEWIRIDVYGGKIINRGKTGPERKHQLKKLIDEPSLAELTQFARHYEETRAAIEVKCKEILLDNLLNGRLKALLSGLRLTGILEELDRHVIHVADYHTKVDNLKRALCDCPNPQAIEEWIDKMFQVYQTKILFTLLDYNGTELSQGIPQRRCVEDFQGFVDERIGKAVSEHFILWMLDMVLWSSDWQQKDSLQVRKDLVMVLKETEVSGSRLHIIPSKSLDLVFMHKRLGQILHMSKIEVKKKVIDREFLEFLETPISCDSISDSSEESDAEMEDARANEYQQPTNQGIAPQIPVYISRPAAESAWTQSVAHDAFQMHGCGDIVLQDNCHPLAEFEGYGHAGAPNFDLGWATSVPQRDPRGADISFGYSQQWQSGIPAQSDCRHYRDIPSFGNALPYPNMGYTQYNSSQMGNPCLDLRYAGTGVDWASGFAEEPVSVGGWPDLSAMQQEFTSTCRPIQTHEMDVDDEPDKSKRAAEEADGFWK